MPGAVQAVLHGTTGSIGASAIAAAAQLSDPWVLCGCCVGGPVPLRLMDIDLIFKIAAIGIITSILNQVLTRSGRDEQATMTTLAGLVVVLMMVAQEIAELFDLVKTLFHF